MKNLLCIFIGGGFGSVLRFLISHYTKNFCRDNTFPVGTFVVNVLGCLLIGIFMAHLKVDQHLKFLLITGFCGGFTTFSALSAENVALGSNGNYLVLAIYSLSSVIIGFGAVYIGLKIGSN